MKYRNHHAGCCGLNPTRPDGSEWPHVLLMHDGSMLHADTPAEILGELIAGYAAMPDELRAKARRLHAAKVADAAQDARIAFAQASGDFDETDADGAALASIMRADKGVSLLLETPDAPGTQANWEPEVPLYLLTTSYAPEGEFPPIGGNVLWLDPTDEQRYLDSLAEVKIFSYWRHDASRPERCSR